MSSFLEQARDLAKELELKLSKRDSQLESMRKQFGKMGSRVKQEAATNPDELQRQIDDFRGQLKYRDDENLVNATLVPS